MFCIACVEINALGDTEHLLRLLAGCLGGLFVVNAVAAVEFDSLNLLREKRKVEFGRIEPREVAVIEPLGYLREHLDEAWAFDEVLVFDPVDG